MTQVCLLPSAFRPTLPSQGCTNFPLVNTGHLTMRWHSLLLLKNTQVSILGLSLHMIYALLACFTIRVSKGSLEATSARPFLKHSWTANWKTAWRPSAGYPMLYSGSLCLEKNEARMGEELTLVNFIRNALARQSFGKTMFSFQLQACSSAWILDPKWCSHNLYKTFFLVSESGIFLWFPIKELL